MTDLEYDRLRALVERVSGIHLGPSKRALLAGRLARRLRELSLGSYAAYYRYLHEAGEGEVVRLIDAVATNETEFFREPRQFEFLERHLLPRWREEAAAGRRPRRVRAWSAACSTGEEPYSLAMTLLAALPPSEHWEVQILASDVSTRALGRAQAAVWPLAKAGQIPERHLKAFMLRGTGSQHGRMKAGPEIRALIHFARVNLVDATMLPHGRFDLVFCRNVLIYFDEGTRRDVVGRLLDRLGPDGYLFLGHAETLGRLSAPATSVAPGVYGRPTEDARARR